LQRQLKINEAGREENREEAGEEAAAGEEVAAEEEAGIEVEPTNEFTIFTSNCV